MGIKLNVVFKHLHQPAHYILFIGQAHRILERGLVFRVVAARENLYEAVNPNKLSELVRQKERILQRILPALIEQHKAISEEEVYIYKGVEGLKRSMAEILQLGGPVYTMGAKAFWFDPRIADYTRQFLAEAREHGIDFQHIFDADVKTERPDAVEAIPGPHKIFPPEYTSQSCAVIFANRVVTFTGVEVGEVGQDFTVFVQVNRAVANSYKKWFACLWGLLPSEKSTG